MLLYEKTVTICDTFLVASCPTFKQQPHKATLILSLRLTALENHFKRLKHGMHAVHILFFVAIISAILYFTLQQGQGLGRTQQGMSQALAVEKTSKRGGRIVHENDFKKPPPMFGESFKTPPSLSQIQDEYNDDIPGSEEGGVDGDAAGQDVDE